MGLGIILHTPYCHLPTAHHQMPQTLTLDTFQLFSLEPPEGREDVEDEVRIEEY